MPLIEPKFDKRSYREILAETVARIPSHNPEWTNFNDSDPGMTLLQLFAFMTESIIYRANLIPERSRRKFLRLLGLTMRAPAASSSMVTFENPGVDLAVITLQPDRQLYAGNIPFRTEQGLDVLPLTARLYYKKPLAGPRAKEVAKLYEQLYASQLTSGESAEYYETTLFSPPITGSLMNTLDIGTESVDGSLWVALLARARDDIEGVRDLVAGKTLSLGIMPALDADGEAIYPRGQNPAVSHPSLVFELPNTDLDKPGYRRISPKVESDMLRTPGVVELRMPAASALRYWDDLDPLEAGVGDFPPSLEDSDDQDRLVTWLRIRSPEAFAELTSGSRQVHVPLSWVGINAAYTRQRATVAAEALPTGTGEPDQRAVLANTPVIIDSVQLSVNGERWTRIDDLDAAGPEVPPHSPRLSTEYQSSSLSKPVKVFTVDRESGEIRFGDGVHGMRPPNGASLEAAYDYGGGSQGNVGIGVINKFAAGGLKVRNPVPAWGGSDGETVADAERRIPGYIRHRDRLVTLSDYVEITRNVPGVNLGRVEVLPLVHPEQPFQDALGTVTLLVIPRNDPAQPEAPRPDRLFLANLCRYLEPRRLLTTELHVVGPEYIPVWISIGIEVIPGRAEGPVREAVRQAVLDFISPLRGGFEAVGWPLNHAVEVAEITAAAARVPAVAKVNELRLGMSTGEVEAVVPIEGLQLPRVMAVEVVGGSAPSIEEIQGRAPLQPQDGVTPTRPIPVIPESC